MSDVLYDDDKCCYCWGDPRFDHQFADGQLLLTPEGITFKSEHDTVSWPKGSIKGITYSPTHAVDLDEFARTHGLDAAQDVAIGIGMDKVPEPALSILVADPEDVEPGGFDVRVLFRNEYHAKVFGKRAKRALGITFSDAEG